MGASGSGKSTLLRLINRLYEADSGVILLNGDDIRSHVPMVGGKSASIQIAIFTSIFVAGMIASTLVLHYSTDSFFTKSGTIEGGYGVVFSTGFICHGAESREIPKIKNHITLSLNFSLSKISFAIMP